MKILDEIQGKPSIAILRTIEGMRRLKQNKNFELDMFTFGKVKEGICYGCAATAAIQEIAQIELTQENISMISQRAKALSFDLKELYRFEHAINDARVGNIVNLLKFCDITNVDARVRYWERRWRRIQCTIGGPEACSFYMFSLIYEELTSLGI